MSCYARLTSNARLIAAAPELLAACDDALVLVNGIAEGEYFKPYEIADTQGRLSVAIAKATKGEAR